MSGLFITRGPIVQVVDARESVDVQTDPDERIDYRGPLVVLVSKFSASSAEILTGAMKDYRRAVIVGDSRTYGKGTVLSVTDLSRLLRFINRKIDAGSLTHEIAMFYRVNGESNQAKGIEPDIVLPSFTGVMEVGEEYNDNHLPWSRIAPLTLTDRNLSGFTGVKDDVLKELALSSRRRWQKDPILKRFAADVERFKKVRERKDVSLNEKQRLKEYYDEKAAADRVEELMLSGENSSKKASRQDPLLTETMNIAAEYVFLQQKNK